MAVGPFPLAEIVERLRVRVPAAKTVGLVADLNAALNTPPNAQPALYVLCSERGGPAKYTGPGCLIQNCQVQITVVLLVRHASNERTGSGARSRANEVLAQVRSALIGWTPDDAYNALTFRSGRDDHYQAGWYAGQEVYDTDYRIQTEA